MEVPGIATWFDRRYGVIAVEDDVQNVVREIKQISDGRITVYFNPQSEEFDLVERCLDGTDRLVFSVVELDKRIPERLRRADHWGGNTTPERYITPDDQDAFKQQEDDNDELARSMDKKSLDKAMEASERIAHYLDIAGVGYKGSIHVKKDVPRGTS